MGFAGRRTVHSILESQEGLKPLSQQPNGAYDVAPLYLESQEGLKLISSWTTCTVPGCLIY